MKTAIVYLTSLIFILLQLSCGSTTKVTQQYKSPDNVNFQANKVLVIGISEDKTIRRLYEQKMIESLEKEKIIAVKSIDFFETSFTNNKQSLTELNKIETKLLEAGFDAIILTKITGHQSRVSMVDSYRTFSKKNQTFEDYYYSNQHINFREQQERYKVYTTETSLFCICPGKERELLWRGEIELIDTNKVNRNINSFINALFQSFRDNKMLLLN